MITTEQIEKVLQGAVSSGMIRIIEASYMLKFTTAGNVDLFPDVSDWDELADYVEDTVVALTLCWLDGQGWQEKVRNERDEQLERRERHGEQGRRSISCKGATYS